MSEENTVKKTETFFYAKGIRNAGASPSGTPDDIEISPEKQRLFDLINRAAVGDVAAAGEIAEGYFLGTFENVPNYTKAAKWSHYAAKHNDPKGLFVQAQLEKFRK